MDTSDATQPQASESVKLNPVKPPKLPKTFTADALPSDRLDDFEVYASLRLSDANVSGQEVRRVTIETALLAGVTVSGARLQLSQLRDTRFDHCDLSAAEWFQCDVRRVELRDCRAMGFAAVEAQVQDLVVTDCNAQLANFRFSTVERARFERCDLSAAEFTGARLTDVVFTGCDLRNADFSGAILNRVDLRGAQIEGMRAGFAELRGALLTPPQALALVRQAGIIVEWE
jgi:uncharacterized protein YjbI with pentapeptide repeats